MDFLGLKSLRVGGAWVRLRSGSKPGSMGEKILEGLVIGE